MWAKYVIWTMFAWVIWVIKFHNWTRLLCIANVPKLFVLNMFAHEAHVSKPKLSPLVLNNRMWRITHHFTKRSLYRSPASPPPTLGTGQYCYTLCLLSVTYQLPDCKVHLSTTSQKIRYTNSHFFFSQLYKPKYWASLYIYSVLFFCLLLHRLAVRISLPFYDFPKFSIHHRNVKPWGPGNIRSRRVLGMPCHGSAKFL